LTRLLQINEKDKRNVALRMSNQEDDCPKRRKVGRGGKGFRKRLIFREISAVDNCRGNWRRQCAIDPAGLLDKGCGSNREGNVYTRATVILRGKLSIRGGDVRRPIMA